MSSKKTIGFLSFLPDAGQVIPMLKVAVAMRQKGYGVICYFPQECQSYADLFQVPMVSLGGFKGEIDHKAVSKVTNLSPFLFYTIGLRRLRRIHDIPIQEKISRNLTNYVKLVRNSQLSILVADGLLFTSFSKVLAYKANLPLVFQNAEGSLRYLQSPLTFAFGMKSRPLGAVIFYYTIFLGYLGIKQFFYHFFVTPKKSSTSHWFSKQVPMFSTGLGPLEKDVLRVEYDPAVDSFFFPVSAPSVQPNHWELDAWLAKADAPPVVYVSFGTKIQPQRDFLAKVMCGILGLNVRVLWFASKEQKDFLKSFSSGDRLRVEYVVSQIPILNHPNVKCFVTHGGSGGIQESLLAGKPMLCIPFTFDQPYNGSIVSALGVAITLSKKRISERSITDSVRNILVDTRFAAAAKKVSYRLQEGNGAEAVCHYLEQRL